MEKTRKRLRRRKAIRKKISGSSDKPRMAVHKSNKSLYVQIIDDVEGATLCGMSAKAIDGKAKTCKNIDFATKLGEKIAKVAMEKGIKKVVFDRSGYKYHGVVKAIADAARKSGLEF